MRSHAQNFSTGLRSGLRGGTCHGVTPIAACARWLTVREPIAARAAAAFGSLCAAHLPAHEWLAVHVRQTDRMYAADWHFGVPTLVRQIAERAAGLVECGGDGRLAAVE